MSDHFDGYRGFDVATHAAIHVSISESVDKPLEYIDNNVLETARVALGCAKAGLKLVYISSAAVYRNLLSYPYPKIIPQTLSHPMD